MTQAQTTFQTPRLALAAMLLAAAMAIGLVSGIVLAGTPLLGGLGGERSSAIDPAVLLSGNQWERQREQQMFGTEIPSSWFTRATE